jgi:hypothetical protein
MVQYSDAGGIGNPLFILFYLLKEENKNREKSWLVKFCQLLKIKKMK